ncbi:MAG: MATE family efflux transporter [Gammaproteobacteria bacterium]|nr:MATE family efflux transporter [Gammaproteobacteria bacterium]MDH4315763.1 MATE family efflux transporter [Gammaproteobacteria bacterium]MDH5214989.1 MATE family efflux transporter [Gammaproteobacteria bacterium]MDH5501176.1 MATE family efflux transporter [Gammaproteobacteria bacterium]
MSSVPGNQDVWRIAAPMILSNISVPLLGMVDTGVIGHLDDAVYLAAVAIGATIFGFLYTGVNFLRMGTTGIAAQCYGANDYDGLRVALGQAIIVALGIASALLVLQAPLAAMALDVLGAGDQVTAYAREYFSIRIWSAPATLTNYALMGWFLGLQNARVPLYIAMAINLTNIALDLVLVVGLGYKVDGVAAASVIAEFTGLAVGLAFVFGELKRHPGQWLRYRFTRFREYAGFFAINGHLLIRTLSLMFTFAFVTAQGARLGGLILAANAVLMNLQHLLSFVLDGLAHAAEALVGKAVGSKNRDALHRAVALTLRWSLYLSVGFSLAYAIGGQYLVRVLTDLPDVRATTFEYLPWLVLLPVVSVWSFLYDGVYVGATRARAMRDIMIMSTFLVFLPSWFALRSFGNHGLWLAFTLFMASRGIGMHVYYRRKILVAAS